MKYKIYKNKESLMTVYKDNEEGYGHYHCGLSFIEGGVRPELFFTRKELFKFLRKNRYRRTHLK